MCTHPNIALDYGISSETGKHIIRFKKIPLNYDLKAYMDLYPKDVAFLVPCGHCPECLTNYRKQWATRCVCESIYHKDNCFITLTYDDEHYKYNLSKDDVRDFIKKLRNWKINVRYFGCGEKGSHTGRNHYHLILFGYIPEDLKYYSKSNSGCRMYTSSFLSSIWNNGHVIVQNFTKKTASYVAGYISKKLGSSDGFLMMSSHPGLGYQFYQDHKKDIFEYDQIYLGMSGINKVPRYFIKLLEADGFDLFDFRNKRKKGAMASLYRNASNHRFELLDKSFKYNDLIALRKYNRLVRSM